MFEIIHTARPAFHDYMDRLYSARRARYRRRRRPQAPTPGAPPAWNALFDKIRSSGA